MSRHGDRQRAARGRGHRALGRPVRAAVLAPLPAARAHRPADRLVAAAPALLVVGGAGGDRRGAAAAPTSGICLLFLIGAVAMRGAGSHLQRHRRPRHRRPGRAHAPAPRSPRGRSAAAPAAVFLRGPGADRARGAAAVQRVGDRASGCARCVLGGDLPVHEARHRLAAGGARAGLRLGRADGLGGGVRPPRLAGRSCSTRARICWTIGYDTIYALQDIEDDAIAGIRSTARLFGRRVAAGVGRLLRPGGDACSAGGARGRGRRLRRRLSASRPSRRISPGRSRARRSRRARCAAPCSGRTGTPA